MTDEVRKLAVKHWKWIENLLEEFERPIATADESARRGFLFIEAFIHGYKHGRESIGKCQNCGATL